MGCSTEMVGIGVPIELEGLSVELDRNAEATTCYLKFEHTCLQGGAIRYTNLNREQDLVCDTEPTKGWTFKYTEFVTEFFVMVEICTKDFVEPEPEPEPEPEDLTDYERIANKTKEIVNESTTILGAAITTMGGGITDIKTLIDDLNTGLTEGIAGLLGDLTEVIDGVYDCISSEISDLSGALSTGFEDIGDKIDELTFPTIDSIKDAFLDVCEELALALWNRIIDIIEERYPDDEEE